ncbi:MAG: GFA family protein [Phenylobacterium sp.]|uniref:GFA family protein n=1 Tax=Phenylobacterium sp. TaxID=1871053 RepID=UPI002735A93D|nr:GFA family protein [Phenylobacterium sp.]MDP3747364.1 GFA family protein [Phenylobacterium sp.]
MPRYLGSCHCGQVRFAIEAELDHVRVCDCSICRRRGALIHRVAEAQFELLSPLDELATHRFITRQATDYFCPHCGILPFRRPRTAPHLWAINVRCLEDIDLDAIRIERVSGSRLP